MILSSKDSDNIIFLCASGSVVEYRLAKARVAGSNPVSRFFVVLRKSCFKGLPLFFVSISLLTGYLQGFGYTVIGLLFRKRIINISKGSI